MSNFVKIGKHRVNLDHVTDVLEFTDNSIRVYWDYSVQTDTDSGMVDYQNFSGDEAKLLLAIIDQDDETVDEIYQRQYEKAKPAVTSTHPAIQIVAETPRGHAIFMTNDFDC